MVQQFDVGCQNSDAGRPFTAKEMIQPVRSDEFPAYPYNRKQARPSGAPPDVGRPSKAKHFWNHLSISQDAMQTTAAKDQHSWASQTGLTAWGFLQFQVTLNRRSKSYQLTFAIKYPRSFIWSADSDHLGIRLQPA
jgi:hypothetical protein